MVKAVPWHSLSNLQAECAAKCVCCAVQCSATLRHGLLLGRLATVAAVMRCTVLCLTELCYAAYREAMTLHRSLWTYKSTHVSKMSDHHALPCQDWTYVTTCLWLCILQMLCDHQLTPSTTSLAEHPLACKVYMLSKQGIQAQEIRYTCSTNKVYMCQQIRYPCSAGGRDAKLLKDSYIYQQEPQIHMMCEEVWLLNRCAGRGQDTFGRHTVLTNINFHTCGVCRMLTL